MADSSVTITHDGTGESVQLPIREGTVGTPAVDTIADFTVGIGGDVLDLSDMLQSEDLACRFRNGSR